MTKTVYELLKDKWVKLVKEGRLNGCFDMDIECYGNYGMQMSVGEWSTHIYMGNFNDVADALAHLRFGNIPWLLQSNYDSGGKIKTAKEYYDELSDKELKKLKKMLKLIDSALRSDEKDLNIINKNSEKVFFSVVELYNEIFNDLPFHSCIEDFGDGSKFRGSKYVFVQYEQILDEFEDWKHNFELEKHKKYKKSVYKIKELWETNTFDDSNLKHQKYLAEFKEVCKWVMMENMP